MEYFDDDGAGSSNSANNAIPPPASGAGHFEDPGFLGGYSATPGASFYPPNVFQRTVREEHLKLQFSNEFLISTEPRRRGDQLDAMTMPHFQKYEKIGHPIGEGTYGTVWKAKLKDAAKALIGMEEQASTSDFFPDDVAATTSSALKKRRLAAFDGGEDATAASEDEPPHEDVLAEEDGHDPEDERAPEREHSERLFALKKVNLRNEKEGFPLSAIREIRLLKRLKHPNIVALRDLIWTPQERANKFRGVVHLVFEFVEHDLTGLLIYRKRMFHLSEVKNMATQILTGLNFLHQHEIMHRDLKLSNVLVSNDGVLKIADFGLSRYCEDPGLSAIAVLPPVEFQEVDEGHEAGAPLAGVPRSGASSPARTTSNARNYKQRAADDPERPQHPGHSSSNAAGSAAAAAVPPSVVGAQFTNRVITLWYRPPELLLGCKVYGKEVDIWSVGCVIGELILGRPLFPLDNEKKVYQRIAEFCGKPTPDTWPDLFFKKASVFPHRQAFGVEMGLARGCQTADERMFQMEEDDDDDFGVPVDGVEEGDEDFNEYETPFEELFGKVVVVVDPVVVDGDHVGHATTGSTGGGRSATKGSFMASMLAMDPSRRKSCQQILSHAFLRTEPPLACRNEEIKVNKKLNLHEMQAVKVRDKDKKMREAREELNRRKLRGGTAGGRWE
eukprot:g2239.t1